MIKPTVGRKVWFRPERSEVVHGSVVGLDSTQPMDATIVFVHNDRCVNLLVLDQVGLPHRRERVKLVQDEDANDYSASYCEWMPYQVGQSKKDVDPQEDSIIASLAPDTRPKAVEITAAHSVEPENKQPHDQLPDVAASLATMEWIDKAMSAPRVSLADVEASIASEHYFTAQDGKLGAAQRGDTVGVYPELQQLTFCVLVLRNGTKIVGINYGAIDPVQHSAKRGRDDARADAIRQVWPLLGYALRDRLAQDKSNAVSHHPV